MHENYRSYRSLNYRIPKENWGWNLYGASLENMGRDGNPEPFSMPEPGDDQMLVRIDSVGICFSDVKIMMQGGKHPKLYNRDLVNDPIRLGHEVSLTVVKVGRMLQDQYRPGQRLAVQPRLHSEILEREESIP